MSQLDLSSDTPLAATLGSGFTLWLRQALAIFRIEYGKTIFSRQAFICYALAGIPLIIYTVATYESMQLNESVFGTIEEARTVFGQIFSTLILGGVIYLGCASIFTALFRGEILNRSIHYYLLAPVRREVLVTGKFLAGLAGALSLFMLCTLLCFLLMYVPFGMGQLITDITTGIAVQQMGQYLGITLLACLGYGSVFMAAGLLFRNPLIPIIFISAWEFLHFILPPWLKVFSIIHYLKGLLPIPLDEGPLAVIVAPPPVWASFVGMFLLSAAMLASAFYLLKRIEVKYTDE